MHTVREVSGPEEYLKLPKIASSQVKLMWHSDYWDGPKDGMLIYQGEKCWFQLCAENEGDHGWYRRFLVIRLTDEQVKEETHWHDLFRECVGGHADYDERGHCNLGDLRLEQMWSGFYGPHKERKPRDLSNNPVIGWFES